MADSKRFPVQVTISAVDEITYKVMEINEKIKKATEPLNKLKTAFADLGRESGLGKLGAAAGRVGSNFKDFLGEAGKATAILGGLGYATFRLVKGTSDYAGAIVDASERLGVSTDRFQEWQYAAEQAGVAGENVESILMKFNKAVAEASQGTGDGADLFKVFKIPLKDARGNIRSIEQLLPEVADKIQKIENPVLRNAVAMKLFGKEGAKFGNVLKNGSQGLNDLAEQARKSGAIISGDALQATDEFGDRLAWLTRQFNAIKTTALAELMPVLIDLLKQASQWLTENRGRVTEWAREFGKELPSIISGLGNIFAGLGMAIGWVSSILSGLNSIFGTANVTAGLFAATILGKTIVSLVALGASMIKLVFTAIPILIKGLLSLGPIFGLIKVLAIATWTAITGPVGIVIAAIAAVAGAAYLIYRNWEPIKEFFSELWDGIVEKFTSSIEWILGKLGAVKDLFGGIFGGGSAQNVNVRQFGPSAPALGAAAVGQSFSPRSQTSRTENQITVNFENMPRGTRVKTEKAEAPIDLNLGYGMVGP